MTRNEKGFTLIEIVMVIVLLGILAAAAIPRFIDLTDEANQAAANGFAGAAASGMAINYAGCLTNVPPHTVDAECRQVDNCNDASSVVNDWDPSITVQAIAANVNSTSVTCNLVYNGYSGFFQAIGAGN